MRDRKAIHSWESTPGWRPRVCWLPLASPYLPWRWFVFPAPGNCGNEALQRTAVLVRREVREEVSMSLQDTVVLRFDSRHFVPG